MTVAERRSGFDVEHGLDAGLESFALGKHVHAVMCANDEVAMGMYRAARVSGVRVPNARAVIRIGAHRADVSDQPSLLTQGE